MARRQRRPKVEFWAGLIFVVLLAYALIADWWKEHSVLGWTIVGVAVAILAFSIYKFEGFRNWLFGTVKKAGQSLVYDEPKPSGREPLNRELREYILGRADNRCENPSCNKRVPLKIHHIDGNHNHNAAKNLIALCGTCHDLAEIRKYPPHQLKSWVWKSQRRKRWQKERADRPRFRH